MAVWHPKFKPACFILLQLLLVNHGTRVHATIASHQGSLYGELNHIVTFVVEDVEHYRSVLAHSYIDESLVPATKLPRHHFKGWYTKPEGEGIWFKLNEIPVKKRLPYTHISNQSFSL